MTNDIHVMPNFGKLHELSAQCWCRPVMDPVSAATPGSAAVWIHWLAN